MGSIYVTKRSLNLLQSLKCFDAVLIIHRDKKKNKKQKSRKQHTQNGMEASLSLCKHTKQTTDGGWQSGFVERRRKSCINEDLQREERGG